MVGGLIDSVLTQAASRLDAAPDLLDVGVGQLEVPGE